MYFRLSALLLELISGAILILYLKLSHSSFSPLKHDIYQAVDEWLDNSTSAIVIYGNISSWNTTGISSMSNLFSSHRNSKTASFNQPLNAWDVSNVVDMISMFRGASSFIWKGSLDRVSIVSLMCRLFMFAGCISPEVHRRARRNHHMED